MWKKTFTKCYEGINKEDIWSLWADVNNWPKWHHDLEYCTLEGAFEVGNFFMLKPKGNIPAVKIELTEINPNTSFTDCTTFGGAKMYDTHTLEETKNGLVIGNEIVVKGPLAAIWVKMVAEKVADTIPSKVDALAALAKEQKSLSSR